MALRRWLDQLLGRGDSREEGPAVTATARREEEQARLGTTTDDVEEGARAARDELVSRDTPMPPPGTG